MNNFNAVSFCSLLFQCFFSFFSLPTGTAISLETSNSLLDLLCYYGDKEPSTDYHFQQSEKSEELVMGFGSDFLNFF